MLTLKTRMFAVVVLSLFYSYRIREPKISIG